MKTCGTCNGRGEMKVQQGFFSLNKKCPTCKGVGKIIDVRCDVCGGDGTVEKEREFEVAIPAATEDGATRRVSGQGEPGRFGGAAGDLNVIVRVKPHAIFRREGDVVICEVPISVTQAALGGIIDVPTLDGKVEMRVPAGTQPGTIFRLRGKGLGGANRGDAHVRLSVETPTALTDQQRAMFEALQASLKDEQLPARAKFLETLRR
jgi:molecular chaperone DnaJ